MYRDHYALKQELNRRAQQAAENARMERLEQEFMPIGWLLIAVVVGAVIVSWVQP